MSNQTVPPLESGFVGIPNDVYDKLCTFRIPGQVRQIIDCVVRKTYGFNKSEDWIAQTQIIQMTGMNKGNVSRELKRTVENKVIIRNGRKLRLNKNLDEWLSFEGNHFNPKLSDTITSKKVIVSATLVIGSDNKKLSEATVTTNRNNIQQTASSTLKENSLPQRRKGSKPTSAVGAFEKWGKSAAKSLGYVFPDDKELFNQARQSFVSKAKYYTEATVVAFLKTQKVAPVKKEAIKKNTGKVVDPEKYLSKLSDDEAWSFAEKSSDKEQARQDARRAGAK